MRELRRELVFQLIETSRLLQTYVDQRAKAHGTTRAQWAVLGRIRRQEGLTQVDLAGLLELQPISLVRLLDRLVDQGFVERRIDVHDRRVKRLYLTALGHRMIAGLDPLGDDIRMQILKDVEADDMQAFCAMLAGMKDRIKQLTLEAPRPAAKPPEVEEAALAGDAFDRHAKIRQRS